MFRGQVKKEVKKFIMKIEIEKRNDIPSGIEKHVANRVKKLAKYLKEESSMKFVISHQKGNFLVEIILNDTGNVFHSKAGLHDVKLSIDEAIEKIRHQFKKFKEKIADHKNIHLPKIEVLKEEKESQKAPLVKTRRIEPLLLFPEEAISELEVCQEPFFVFINKKTNMQSIVHKIKNGDYQIIEF